MMTKDEAIEYLPLITALAEGKTIQWRPTMVLDWKDVDSPEFNNFIAAAFRIKPEPKVIWVNEYVDGEFYGYIDKDRALDQGNIQNTRRAVKYIEVIE